MLSALYKMTHFFQQPSVMNEDNCVAGRGAYMLIVIIINI